MHKIPLTIPEQELHCEIETESDGPNHEPFIANLKIHNTNNIITDLLKTNDGISKQISFKKRN